MENANSKSEYKKKKTEPVCILHPQYDHTKKLIKVILEHSPTTTCLNILSNRKLQGNLEL